MISLNRRKDSKILMLGVHPQIIQSVLDFDYARGAKEPSISAVVGGNKKTHKCWFGDKEILLPNFKNIKEAKQHNVSADWFINVASANSARKQTEQFFENYRDATGGHVFCESLSEQDALVLVEKFGDTKLIAGSSGVGLMIPGVLKLGAIGGIFGSNIKTLSQKSGNTAIICCSGGMVNELINSLYLSGGAPSFAVSFGGERFPITSPLDWCLIAEADEETEQILYFGELGGLDEYLIAEAVKSRKITKPVYAYIAGHYEVPGQKIQFGHAKALAKTPAEDAKAKIKALAEAGATVAETFNQYSELIKDMTHKTNDAESARGWSAPDDFREPSMFTAVRDRGSCFDSFTKHALSVLLEKKEISNVLVDFTEKAFSLLMDHGAQPSGSVNTMITARAGRDMSSALATGVLTVGDRFGGAINKSASTWYMAIKDKVSVEDLLEQHKSRGEYLMGVGHKKYSIYEPDPRVEFLTEEARKILKTTKHLDYAESVAERTVKKKPNLILNVDGVLAAVILDILIEHENFDHEQMTELFEIEFFNSYFLIPRTVGFIGNFLSQKRRDEGLFRLPEDEVFYE